MQYNKLLVFPTSRAIRTFISQDSSNRLIQPILTIDEFFLKSIYIKNATFINDEHRFLLLKEATKEKNLKKLGIPNSFNEFIKQSEYIFRFFGELSAENIEFSAINKADTYEFYAEHLKILEEIYKSYCQLLEKNGYVDKITISKKYKINGEFLKNFEEVTIFFEGYFTHFEFSIIEQVSKIIPLYIELITNKYNKKSYEKFKNIGFELKENCSYILDISNKKIVKEEPLVKQKQNLEIKAFSQRVNQIAYIKKSITNMIEKDIKPNEIVVILPDESFSQTLELFDNDMYFNYAMGRGIKNSNLYKSAFAIYEYISDDEQKNIDFINFLKLDFEYINVAFKTNWNKQISKETFDNLINFIKKYETNKDVLEKFEEDIYLLEKSIFDYKDTITLAEAFKFLLQKLSAIKLDDINGYSITVMGLLETRAISYKGVIIVDFNENFVPKKSIKDKFLSTNVKKFANLPTLKDRENLQKYYYSKLCNNAKYLYISYVQNETNTISRFANELFNTKIESYTNDSIYKNIMFKTKQISHNQNSIVLDINLSNIEWSATSLKTFLECKRKYYFSYLANIKEHHFSPKPQNFEIGNIIHKILEKFYKNHKSIDETTPNNILNSYLQEQKESNPYMILELELWKKRFIDFIKNEKDEFLQKRKSIYKTELPFKFKYNNITLKGIIDRVDIGANFFEIIDYKTSSTLKVDTQRTYANSKDFQLEFYYLAMQEYINSNDFKDYKITPYYYDLNKAKLLQETLLDEKIVLLEEKLEELKKDEVDFIMCENKTTCQFCPYTTICNR